MPSWISLGICPEKNDFWYKLKITEAAEGSTGAQISIHLLSLSVFSFVTVSFFSINDVKERAAHAPNDKNEKNINGVASPPTMAPVPMMTFIQYAVNPRLIREKMNINKLRLSCRPAFLCKEE